MEKMDQRVLLANQWAKEMRKRALDMALSTGKNGSHIGGGFSAMEIFAVLYSCIIKNTLPVVPERDRVIVSKGHCVLAYYTALWKAGFITDGELESFDKNGTHFYGHPSRNLEKGIEFSAGSLSLGLSFSVGVALACQRAGFNNRIYVILGDGECNEGLIWESLMAISHYNLTNLTLIVDSNGLQLDGYTYEVMNMFSLEKKFNSFGLDTYVLDGHDCEVLLKKLTQRASRSEVIIAKTIKGKGIATLENNKLSHHCVLTREQYEETLKTLI